MFFLDLKADKDLNDSLLEPDDPVNLLPDNQGSYPARPAAWVV